MNTVHLKRLLVAFWFLWLVIVWASNLCDGLKELGLLATDWPFASGNFQFMSRATARYGTPGWGNAVLYFGVLLWEGAAAVLFGLALWKLRPSKAVESPFLYPAFTASLMLLAAFILADEVLIAYAVEETHLRLFIAQLLTLVALAFLPEPVLPAS